MVNIKRLELVKKTIESEKFITEKDVKWIKLTINRKGYDSICT